MANHRLISRGALPLAGAGAAGVPAYDYMRRLTEPMDHWAIQPKTMFHLPFSIQMAIIFSSVVGATVLIALETAASIAFRSEKVRNIPPNRIDILKFAKQTRKINDSGKVLGTNLISALRLKAYDHVRRLISQIGSEVGVRDQVLYTRAGQAAEQLSALVVPAAAPAAALDPVAILRAHLAGDRELLGLLPLDQRRVEAKKIRAELSAIYSQLPDAEQLLAVELITKIQEDLDQAEAQLAASPPAASANPFSGISGISVPPPPPFQAFGAAVGDNATVASSPPRATVVPTPPGPAGPPVVTVPPPPPAAPTPAKEPSAIIRAGRALARGAARLVGRGAKLPPPPAGAGSASAPLPPPRRRVPITDPDFYAAFKSIQQVQEKGGDKNIAILSLEELKKKNKLNTQQAQAVEEYLAKLREFLQIEDDMRKTPDPALQAQYKRYLEQLSAAAKQKGDEISVAIVAGQGGISNDEATVVILDIEKQIQVRWQELQTLLAGESQDSIDQTKAVMAGELWESAPTVNVDQKLTKAFAALLKRAKPIDPAGLGLIERFFHSGLYKTVLDILEKQVYLKKLGIAEDQRYREFLLLLGSYTSGPGGN